MSQFGATGWIRDDEAVAAFVSSGIPQPHRIAKADGVPLAGYWQSLIARGVKGVFIPDAELELFGRYREPELQRRGTCVGRGTFRALQDSWYWRLAKRGVIGKPVTFAYEQLYGDARVAVGHGELGRAARNPNNDGCIGAWAAQALHDIGIVPRGQYGTIDLTRDREDLAVQWGDPGYGAPASLHKFCYRARACFDCRTIEGMADAIAAGYAVAYCSNLLYGANDADGYARPEDAGGHCEEYCGVFLDRSGNLCFLKQGSWGSDYPGGAHVLQYAGGQKTMRPGCSGIRAEHVEAGLKDGGEAWAFDLFDGPQHDTTEEALQ